MTELLDQVLDAFKEDSDGYQELQVLSDTRSRRAALRSLMNIRMPLPARRELLELQDRYLLERRGERGVVTLDQVPVIRSGLSIWQGDITRLACDAIVNAANSQMLGCFVPMHTCIDNCIHTYAGIQLRLECSRRMEELKRKYGPDYEQPTALPMLTGGYNLPAKHVIHVVGPIVTGEVTQEDRSALAACYENSLEMCREHGLRSIAFCCISTGVFRFPADLAAQIAVRTVLQWQMDHPGVLDRIVFNVFRDEDRRLYEALLGKQE